MTEIRVDEWMEELSRLFRENPAEDAMTSGEIVEASGHSEHWVRAKLRLAISDGSWECVRVPRKALDGVARIVPAYRPKRRQPPTEKR